MCATIRVGLATTQRTSDYQATVAVNAMKGDALAFSQDRDEELISYFRTLPLWVVRHVMSDFLAKYPNQAVYPSYERVAPLIDTYLMNPTDTDHL